MKEELEAGNAYLNECIEARKKYGPLYGEEMTVTVEPGAVIQLPNGNELINQTGSTIKYLFQDGELILTHVNGGKK